MQIGFAQCSISIEISNIQYYMRKTTSEAPRGWAPPQTIGAALQLFAANLCRFAAGEPLLNPVDKQRGY